MRLIVISLLLVGFTSFCAEAKRKRKNTPPEVCENAENDEDAAFRCNCWQVMKVKKDKRTDDQKQQAQACYEKRKEKMGKERECRKAIRAVKLGSATEKLKDNHVLIFLRELC